MENSKKEFLEKIRRETISKIMIEANKKLEESIDPKEDTIDRIMEDELFLKNIKFMCDDTIFPMLVNEEYLKVVIMDKVKEVTSLFPKEKEKLTLRDNKLYINTGYKDFDTNFTTSLEKIRMAFDYDKDKIEELFMSWLFCAIRRLEVVSLGIEYALEKKCEQFIYTYKYKDPTDEFTYTANALYYLYGKKDYLTKFSVLEERVKELTDRTKDSNNDFDEVIVKLSLDENGIMDEFLDVKRVSICVSEIENALQYVFRGLGNVLACNDGQLMALNNAFSFIANIVNEVETVSGDYIHASDYQILKHLGCVMIGFIHNVFMTIMDFEETSKTTASNKSLYSEKCLYPMMVTYDYLLRRIIEDGKYFYQKPVESTISNIASAILDHEVLISNFSGNFTTEREYISNAFGLVDKRTKRTREELNSLKADIKSFNVGASAEKNNLCMIHNGSFFRGVGRKPSLAFYFTFETSTENAMNYIKSFYLRNVLSLNLDSIDNGDKLSDNIFKYFKNKDKLAIVTILNKEEIFMSSGYEKFRRKFITNHTADIVVTNIKAKPATNELSNYLDGLVVVKPSNLQQLFSLRTGSTNKGSTILGSNNDLYNFLIFLKRNIVSIGSGIESNIAVGRQLTFDLENDSENRPLFSCSELSTRDDYIMLSGSKKDIDRIIKMFSNNMDALIAIKKIMFILSEYYNISFISNTVAGLDIFSFIIKEEKFLKEAFSTGISNKDIIILATLMLKAACEQINEHLGRNIFPPMMSDRTNQFSTSPIDVYEYTFNIKIMNVINSVKVKNTKFSIDISGFDKAFEEVSKQTEKVVKKPKAKIKKKPKPVYENSSDLDYKLDYINTDLDLKFVIKKLGEGKLVKCLIEGVPGSGKSEFAYHVAKELGVDVNYINVSDYTKKYVGEGEERMSKLFNDAEKYNKLVIIDECDTLFTTRDDDKLAHYAVSMTNHMLNEINKRKLNMFFTTNFLDRIDSAMIRRIDLKLKFGTLKKEHKYPLFEELLEKCSCKGKIKKEDICKRLDRIELTPGVFKSTLNRLQWVENVNIEKALEELERESKLILKSEGKSLGFCI